MSLLRIQGGRVYDPVHGVDGQVADVWLDGGKVVPAPTDPSVRPVRTIDARGMVVMPGGVDMHCHIAGPKVNLARKMRPDDKRTSPVVARRPGWRSGTLGAVPSTFATGYKYAALGYTTAFDAAITPLAAHSAHQELADTPCLDKGFFVLMGNNHFIMQAIRDREPERLRAFVGWLLGAARGYAPKIVNPGGVEVWKETAGNVHGLDEQVGVFNVTPRAIVSEITRAANELKLPHPVHIHCNNLGVPGNWSTTLETMRAIDGQRGHLTHIQFHSYGGGPDDETSFNSKVQPLADYVNAHQNITVDVGQVLFGRTTSMTGDGPLGYYLSRVYKTKWFSSDTELEAGCGICPIEYKDKSLINALQWAIGLEWFLLVNDPWRVALTTDHPNGGSFLAYPQIIKLLMDSDFRREVARRLPEQVRQRSLIGELDRKYSLYEIAIITRAGPARMLGLRDKGHLGVGADADVTIYAPNADVQQMFELPRYVIKAGQVIVDDAELCDAPMGQTLAACADYDRGFEPAIAEWFNRHSTIRFSNYPVHDIEGLTPSTTESEVAG
ncbi:MAG: formylmethanofuran dehydrogenase subunit A [Planctomycetes bacterium]|nr:formylmethanofuran dehydrogenase subunit A [Planctomycetota bacterium]